MRTYEYQGAPFSVARSHPWTDAVSNSAFRYYDLTEEPGRIRRSMEDFVPWSHDPAIEKFYSMLEWLHEPRSEGNPSLFESNDCAFTGPHENDVSGFAKALQCTGRLMLLYRDLARNRSEARLEDLKNHLHQSLQRRDPDFEWGVIATTIVPVRYLALSALENEQSGYQLMLSFWAWGDHETQVMANLGRVFGNLFEALREVSAA